MKYIVGVAVAVCLVVVTPAHAATPQARRPPLAGTRSQLTAVRLRPARDSIRIVFVVQGPIRYESRTGGPARITIDLLQTTISPLLTHREILSEHPALIRILLARSAGSTRVILDLAAAGSHSIYRAAASSQLVVDIKTMAGEAAARTVPPPPLAPPPPSVHIEPAPSTVRPPSVEPESGRLATVRIPWIARRPDMDELTAASTVPEGARVAGFRQREPADGSPVSEGTFAYLSYDNENLYVVFACKDEPGKIRSHLTPREDIGGDDQVTVYLDTFHDGRHAYVFASNPSGVQQDGIINEGHDPTYEIDRLWYSQGRRTRDGFVVLMAIPFKSIRFSGEPFQEWRIALGRTIARRSETAFWPYISPRSQGFVAQLGFLEGLQLISHGRNIQFMPYGTFRATESRDPDSLRTVRSDQRRAGFDTKVVVKNTVTIDAAVNPDFSEIESNDPQMLVNQRFEVLIPEKRPFFTENAAMFATPINVFFSRRIVDPEFGVKVTARSTKWAIAGLSANDRAVAAQDADGVFGRTAKVGAARIERNFGDRSKLAVLSTERQVGHGSNAVVSVDGRTNLGSLWTISGQAVRSDDVDQSGGRVNGTAYFAGIARNGRHFTYLGSYRDIDGSFRAPLGYVPRVDLRATEQYASYMWQPDDSGKWSFGPSVSTVVNWDRAGRFQDRWTTAELSLSVAGQVEVLAARNDALELYAGVPFRTRSTSVSLSSNTPAWVSLWASYSRGTGINYSPPAHVAPFLGNTEAIYTWLLLRLAPRLRFEQTYLQERLDTLPDVSASGTQMAFGTQLLQWKANLQMTKALALRAILDYNQLASDRLLFSETASSQLVAGITVTFLVHPGTAVYFGFNDKYENVIDDPFAQTRFRPTYLPTVPVGRQIFAKISYLLGF